MEKRNAFDIGYTAIIFVLLTVLGIVYAYLYGAKVITNTTFFIVYGILGGLSIILVLISVVLHVIIKAKSVADNDAGEEIASAFFLSDTTSMRPLSNPLTRIITVIILLVFVSIIVFAAGSLIPVYNPYDSTQLSKSVLDQHPLFMNILTIGPFPGLFEEVPIFFLINTLIMSISLLASVIFKDSSLKFNPAVILIAALIAIPLGSGLFVLAHSAAYSMNTAAYITAFIFEVVVQSANQLTGLFISWLPHMFHNMSFILRETISFSIGAAAVCCFGSYKSIISAYKHEFRLYRADIKNGLEVLQWKAKHF